MPEGVPLSNGVRWQPGGGRLVSRAEGGERSLCAPEGTRSALLSLHPALRPPRAALPVMRYRLFSITTTGGRFPPICGQPDSRAELEAQSQFREEASPWSCNPQDVRTHRPNQQVPREPSLPCPLFPAPSTTLEKIGLHLLRSLSLLAGKKPMCGRGEKYKRTPRTWASRFRLCS